MFEKAKAFLKRLFFNNTKKLGEAEKNEIEQSEKVKKSSAEQDFHENTNMYEYLMNIMKTCDNYPTYKECIEDAKNNNK